MKWFTISSFNSTRVFGSVLLLCCTGAAHAQLDVALLPEVGSFVAEVFDDRIVINQLDLDLCNPDNSNCDISGPSTRILSTSETIEIFATSAGGIDDPFASFVRLNADVISGANLGSNETTIMVGAEYRSPILEGIDAEDPDYQSEIVLEFCGFNSYRQFETIGDEFNFEATSVPGKISGSICYEGGDKFLSPGVYRLTYNDTSDFDETWTLTLLDFVSFTCGEPIECEGESDIQILYGTGASTFDFSVTDALPGGNAVAQFESQMTQQLGNLSSTGNEVRYSISPDYIGIKATSNGGVDDPFGLDLNTEPVWSGTPLGSGFSLVSSVAANDRGTDVSAYDIDITAELYLKGASPASSGNYKAEIPFKVSGLEGPAEFQVVEPFELPASVAYEIVPFPGDDGEFTDGMITSGCYLFRIYQAGPSCESILECNSINEAFRGQWTLLITDQPPLPNAIEEEPNDTQDNRNIVELPKGETDLFITGKLEPEGFPGCQPDTYLALFDKQDNRVGFNDDSACAGNGMGSGIEGATLANGMIINNNDGSFSLRAGVTGRGDGLDTTFNGFFLNAPHLEFGGWELTATFHTAEGIPDQIEIHRELVDNPVRYRDEFVTGAEAFRVNYVFGPEVTSVDLCVDNTVGMVEVCNDVDFYEITGLVPMCDYCVEQVGGLDSSCAPTDTLIGWFDKKGTLIDKADGGGAAPGWAKLIPIADAFGSMTIAVTGGDDCDFDGFKDQDKLPIATTVCPEVPEGHGVCGCYTLRVEPVSLHGGTGPGGNKQAAMEEALAHGDINLDHVTDSADLGILVGHFGWESN